MSQILQFGNIPKPCLCHFPGNMVNAQYYTIIIGCLDGLDSIFNRGKSTSEYSLAR